MVNISELINSTINSITSSANLTVLNNTVNSTSDTGEIIKNNSDHQNFLSAKTLIAIIILLVHTIASPIFEKFHFHYIHESGISMLLGMIVGLVAMWVSPTVKSILKNILGKLY